jgi:hypothetical protein
MSTALKILSLNGEAPPEFDCQFSIEDTELIEEGKRLRARLPAYLEQRLTTLTAYSVCPLPMDLQSIVAAYAEPTHEDVWESVT